MIGLALLLYTSNLTKTESKDSSYYLTSPWVTERVDWFFLQLPEKWTENFSEIKKGKTNYDEICNEIHLYELHLKEFHFVCTYMDAKQGVYENSDLDISANAILNQMLYNLKCQDIIVEQLPPFDNLEEINYVAYSNCTPNNYKAKFKGIRYRNHILLTSVYYIESDENYEKIAQRIMNGIESKYSGLENVKSK